MLRYFTAALLLFSSLAGAATGRWELGVDIPLAVLEDRSGGLSVEQVAALPDSAFRRLNSGLSSGYSSSAFWLKFPLPADSGSGELLLETVPPYIDEVILYELTASGWRTRVTGDLHAYAAREIGYRHFLLRVDPGAVQGDLYLRVRSTSTIALRGIFWQPTAFVSAVIPESVVAGLYFGVAGLTIVLALAYGVWLRSRVFLVFAVASTAGTLLVAAINGYHAQLLFPTAPAAASGAVGVLVMLAQGGMVWLTMAVLETATYFPRFYRIQRTAAVAMALCSLSVFSGHYLLVAPFVAVAGWVLSVCGLVAALLLIRKKIPGARILTVAYLVNSVILLSNLLMVLGLVRPTWFGQYGWQAGTLLHMLLLHATMLWRVRMNEIRYYRVQEKALIASVETERELEARVGERTRALTDARTQLEIALANERRALLEQRQFMSMVSHEFRTPLAIIDSVAVNLAEVPPSDAADLAARSEQVQRATRRLARLVDNCLADDRLDSEAFSLQLRNVSPAALAREAAEIVKWSPQHRLALVLGGLPDSIECDPTLVRIALSNLLDNAVKYSEGGTVTLTGEADDTSVWFSVADEGPGLGECDTESLFERFARGTAKKSGAGLGLFVVRRIARLHGGDAFARSQPGGGAVFEFMMLRRQG